MDYGKLKSTFYAFSIEGRLLKMQPLGDGHINDTYLVSVETGDTIRRYVMQSINGHVFKSPQLLMDNYERVTTHLNRGNGGVSEEKRGISLIPHRNGKCYHFDEDGNCWRMYSHIDGVFSCDFIDNEKTAFEGARAFARFLREIDTLPAPSLHMTISDFHNTPWRFGNLWSAVKNDVMGRAAEVSEEIAFFKERERLGRVVNDALCKGILPERITHNDTKINNVLFDNQTKEAVCVIDFDTVMPGTLLYDFGDLLRTGLSASAEDETDISKVQIRFSIFEALVDGFLQELSEVITDRETGFLVFSGTIITMNIGLRFLTDYLSGDVYFKIHRPEHNLDRCRTQIALIRSIEENYNTMMECVREKARIHGVPFVEPENLL